jgi:hypothetical protein
MFAPTKLSALVSLCLCALACGTPEPVPITELKVAKIEADLALADPAAEFWEDVAPGLISLMAQPMVAPRPETTTTDAVQVQAVHDGSRIAFRLRWKDPELSEAGPLGKFSDAIALEFPIREDELPPVMMGAKDHPVHLFHWRAQYQRDHDQGKPEMKEVYPNVSVDMYPMEFKDAKGGTREQAEQFAPGVAEGNPQSYAKQGVDEIIAEGFSTSAVQEGHGSAGRGQWRDGWWEVVITRPLAIEGGSALKPGTPGNIAFAVWQGGQGEVGSRKCVTMMWTPLTWGE